MIRPTVGRKVWYFPQGNPGGAGYPLHDATIVDVISDTSVNLACHTELGTSYTALNIYLLPSDIGDDTARQFQDTPHAEWMPYQVGQAKSNTPVPKVGLTVHYQSYGTPGGEYISLPRAAIITEVSPGSDRVGLCVLNPTGQFFNRDVPYTDSEDLKPGHWSWPV